MFIEKEPQKAIEDKKLKQAVEREPLDPSKAKKDLKGLAFAEQVKAVSAKPKQQPGPATPKAPAHKKDPVAELKKLFRDMSLPDRLVPTNVESFTHNPGTGDLAIVLRDSFSRSFDAENTFTFEKTIVGHISRGSFSGIAGIRKGSAAIVDISRVRDGVLGFRGKLGPSGKALEFKDEQIPSMP